MKPAPPVTSTRLRCQILDSWFSVFSCFFPVSNSLFIHSLQDTCFNGKIPGCLGSDRHSFSLPLKIFVKVFKNSRAASETRFIVFVRHSYASDDAIDSRSFFSRKLRVF